LEKRVDLREDGNEEEKKEKEVDKKKEKEVDENKDAWRGEEWERLMEYIHMEGRIAKRTLIRFFSQRSAGKCLVRKSVRGTGPVHHTTTSLTRKERSEED